MVDYNKELSIERDYLNQTIFQVLKQLENEINKEEDDKKLLYIGCTRALHRLTIFYTATKSRLLK